MWAKDRHHRIVSLLATREQVSLENLAAEFAVSRETLRRDIFRQPLMVESKADASPVTIGDREIEQLLRDGEPLGIESDGRVLAAATPELHAQMLRTRHA